MDRRQFLVGSLTVGAGAAIAPRLAAAEIRSTPHTGDAKMAFQQPPLPYAQDALTPFLTAEQVSFHYGKHHAAYFKKLNGLLEGKPEAALPLAELVVKSAGAVFNNAAQGLNHSFYWDCLAPQGGGEPKGELAAAIQQQFGGLKDFQKVFSDAAAGLFGSGWTWLAADKAGKLEIMSLGNADTPLKYAKTPVLTIDVWEHAYYIDYRNERPRYIEAFWTKVNWEFAAKCFAAARK